MRRLVYEYHHPFTSSVGDWTFHSTTGNDQTIEIGQNAPGEPVTNDWLKLTIGEDPGSSIYFRLDTHTAGDWLPYSYSREAGDVVTFNYKIHLVDGGGDYWGTSGGDVLIANTTGATFTRFSVPLDTTTNVYSTRTHTSSNWNQSLNIIRSGLSTPAPSVGAIYYLKDVVIRLWRE